MDELRAHLIRNALKDRPTLEGVLTQLAPCTPEQDYDKYERFCSGFRGRLKRAQEFPDRRGFIKGAYADDFVQGWMTCDKLLQPEWYLN
jgi:hypothetical protein